ncbi:MAG TPA: protease pro-enzyme activation domain-containing protein [Terracidiphilus sp.]
MEGHAQQPRPAARQLLHGHVRAAVLNGKAALAGALPSGQRLNLSIVLPLRNQAELTNLVSRLYDPSSSDYHHFLSASQFTEQFAPTAEDYQAALQFARANGFTVGAAPANRLVVPISGTAAQVEKTFNVRMRLYHHPTQNRLFFSPDREPSLDLAVPIAHIAGLSNFSTPQPLLQHAVADDGQSAAAATGSGPGGSFLSSDMRAAYYGGTALTGSGQTVGLLEFDGYDASDVNQTFTSMGQSSAVPVNNVLLDGVTGASVSGDDSEEVADIVQAIGMAPGLSQVRVYIGSNDVDLLNAIASEDVAQQVSISWSWSPDDPATDEIFFEECAAQGQSVFAASGDWGEFDPYFDSFYPAEDTFVTATGGTVLTTGDAAWNAETAWNRSGGGISPDGIPIPAWQAGVATSTNGGSTTLRNVPDVAAEANTDNYICSSGVCSGNWGGTSFAAPRWAGFMALVNQQAAQQGEPAVGFLDPLLYTLGQSSNYADQFHDVVIGNNDARGNCCGWPYYNAVPGYDLVTGWGSPSGQGLIDALAPHTSSATYQLSSSAVTVTVAPGSSAATTIAIGKKAGFSGSVSLAVSGLPADVTASWSENPASGTSILTLNAGNSVQRGSYLITVTGRSGSETESTSFALAVNAPGFTLVASPASVKIYPGTSNSVSVVVTAAGGFNGQVHLAVTAGLPAGITAAWVSDPATGISSLTLTASNSISTNTEAMLTITGTSDGQTATTTLALVVNPPVFYLNVSPSPSSIAQGGSVTFAVSAIPVDKTSDTIKLSAPALPPGVTAAFNPSTISFGQTSMLTLTAGSSAPIGAGLVAIEAAGSLAETIGQFNLAVTAKASPSFALSVAESSLLVTQDASAIDGVTVTPQNGFTGSVNLSVTSPLPAGITASFTPSSTTGSSRLTLTASSTAATGFYPLWITGVSGTQSTTACVFVTVNPPPGFSLNASPGLIGLSQGATVTDALTVVPQPGFTGNVNLSVTSPLPAGLTASLGSSSTAANTVLTLAADYAVPAGSYPVTISGSSGNRTVTTTLSVTIAPALVMPTSISLSVTPAGGTLTVGSLFMLTATVTPAGSAAPPVGDVVFNIGSTTQAAPLNASGIAVYSGTVPAAPGDLTLSATYQGTTGFASSASTDLNVIVATAASPQFNLGATAIALTPGAASGNTSIVTITPAGGFTGAVTLTASIIASPTGAKNLPTFRFGGSNPVQVGSSGAASATLIVLTTNGATTTAASARTVFPWYGPGGAALACLFFFGIPSRRRAWRALLGMFALFAILAGGAVGCGGNITPSASSSSAGTTSGVYTIAVTGVSGATTATTHVTLTVE